ncbi:hypothetical protein HDV05_002156 [Chytridiales sp. JEL 0842]|nr:hypothetical protein HDV05_002156 [Chytridiales sp. JEL 0842]
MSASAVCCGRWYNHITLINNVYPSEPGEVGPKSSALSLLVFYCGSKPQKLQKVGAYLEKKVKLDLRQNRIGYVKVTLDIVNAIISQCPTHVNIMANSVLRVVDDVLGFPDPDLLLQATSTFVTFNTIHSHEASMDNEFVDLFSKLLEKYCGFCSYETNDKLFQHKMHMSGLRAIQAIASSETFLLNSKIEAYVKAMVPAILHNFGKHKRLSAHHRTATSPTSPGSSMKRISIADDLFTHHEVEHTAENSLSQLVLRTNATTLTIILNPILAYIDEKSLWSSTSYIMHIVKTITSSVQPQYLHILLSSILDRLDSEAFANNSAVKTGLVKSLSYLVIHGGESVGVAVLELLEALSRQIWLTVSHAASYSAETKSSTAPPTGTKEVDKGAIYYQTALVDAVGFLAVNIEYPDQMNDIIAFLVNKLKLPTDTEDGELDGASSHRSGSPTTPVGADPVVVSNRKVLLRCLARVVSVRRLHLVHPVTSPGTRTSVLSNNSRRSATLRSPITTSLLSPLLALFADVDPEIRIGIAHFMHELLSLEVLELGIGSIASSIANSGGPITAASTGGPSIMASFGSLLSGAPRTGLTNSNGSVPSASEFLAALYKALYAYAISAVNGPADYVALGCLFVVILQRYFYIDGLAATLPVLFRIQSDIKHGLVTSPSRQRALGNLVVEYLAHVARIHQISDLSERISNLREERKAAGEWCLGLETTSPHVVFGGTNEEGDPVRPSISAHTTFEELEGIMSPTFQPLSPARIVDRLMVVESLMSDSHIGRVLPDGGLRERLMVEYIPSDEAKKVAKTGAYMSEERSKSGKGSSSVGKKGGAGIGSNHLVAGNSQTTERTKKASSSVKSSSVKSDVPATVRVEEFREALSANYLEKDAKPGAPSEMIDLHVLSPGATVTERRKPDIRSLLKNVTANFEKQSRKGRLMKEPGANHFPTLQSERHSVATGPNLTAIKSVTGDAATDVITKEPPTIPKMSLDGPAGRLANMKISSSHSSLSSLRLNEPSVHGFV